jgi:site-specific recombinase XerD
MSKATITPASIASAGDIGDNVASWVRDLRSRNLSPRTIRSYEDSARLLAEYLAAQGMPTNVAAITREHVQSFVNDQLARWKPTTAAVRYASLRVFFGWLVDEGEIRDSPMARMHKPKLDEYMAGIPTRGDLEKLLADCEGPSFTDRRDMAIIRVFLSTGARLSEVAGMRWTPATPTTNDVDLDARIIRVMGKGRRERVSYLNPKAVKAVDRYLRARKQHPRADMPVLWLGKQGALSATGISQMVRSRSARLGLAIHPHSFRHYYADAAMRSGMQEGDIMSLAGWRTRDMLSRYAAANRSDRALEAARRLTVGDDL